MQRLDFDNWTREQLLDFVKKRMAAQRESGRRNSAKHIARCKQLGVSSHSVGYLDAKALLDPAVRKGRQL